MTGGAGDGEKTFGIRTWSDWDGIGLFCAVVSGLPALGSLLRFWRSLPGGRNCPDDKIRLLVQTRTAGTVSGKDGKYENNYGGRTEGGSAL